MSTVRANSITNSAGSGAPDFPNGITAATIPAANLTGSLPAIDGSALTNLPAPTTAQVGTATAGLAVDAVGTYAFMQNLSGSAIAAGGTVAGSSLRFSDVNWSATGTPSASGTWRVMGRFSASGSGATGAISVCLRIA